MTEKRLESLIVKIVKKVIKKEIKNLTQDNLPIISSQENQQIEGFIETFDREEDIGSTAEVIDDIYTNGIVNLSAKEDMELERKLRELKFKQELRKDWILFIVRDVVVYSTTILFIFTIAGFYLFTLIQR
ncbi:hypothetical protein H6G54_06885 [Anabaena cylindrica FACHB-243]|uniref:Uncharacterized protein n=1 Tax=Anabaena cylindrica (strain ATCC 27899 / PCC 7122) TaxID=272123 RepID=K9ZC99_ANACC|nr:MULTISPECIES: hypothetical protein [Anabaena]AFZ56207.1 hypothetical protein Anacy_0614 [Anabaena cylindrica PCC 7122]MBD2417435.1 hypothetical protein [Anabaena cylindrica FACHB-243]MBY5284630.1 hypothetical protein [Anabaena sp. CCAP 1446/1C]MBY5311469.1 hypothetical protein [Anabaena sp. CCAP 1446/1C]MCM2407604.1 hypothetical protein [Anabaena sp. CCAP 1446/1C]